MPLAHDAELTGGFFAVEIKGVKIAFFTACSGISVEHDVVEHKTYTETGKSVTYKIPGRAKYAEITLKRGFTPDTALSDWFAEVVQAKATPPYKDGSVVLYNREGTEMVRFNLINMWPSKLSVSDLSAGGDEVMVEEVTMQHEDLEWA